MYDHSAHRRRVYDVRGERAVRQRAEDEVLSLQQGLEAETGRPVPVLLIGALQTSLFSGAKERRYSHNSACPYGLVVEIDLRIIDRSWPHDPEWVNTVSSLFRPSDVVRKRSIHWGRADLPQTTMYRYEPEGGLVDGIGASEIGVEFELCLNQAPYVEISPHWKRLFAPEELAEQRRLRCQLRSSGASLDRYHQFKRGQILEAQWRLLAAVHLETVSREAFGCPRFGWLGEPVAGLAKRWAISAHGDPPSARACRTASWADFAGSLPLPPAGVDPPIWVSCADQYQHAHSQVYLS